MNLEKAAFEFVESVSYVNDTDQLSKKVAAFLYQGATGIGAELVPLAYLV